MITASFNGEFCDAEFSLVLGGSSGTGTISFPDTSVNLPHKGVLVFSDGEHTLTLPNMYVDKPRIERDATGGAILSATIYDRRYAWQWGYIVGNYNQPDYTNTPTAEVPLVSLIQLCLEALGEVNPVLINIPNTYTSVSWEPELPATALEDLCDEHGLVIGLDASKSNFPIVIAPYDYECTLPSSLNSLTVEGVSSAIKPHTVRFFGGRHVFQEQFSNLIPVGEDTNGEIKRIEDLSFAPLDWGDSLRDMFTDLNTQQARELADKCVFKWYAVNWDTYNPKYILPFLTSIVDIIVDEGVVKRDKPYILATKTLWDGVSFVISSNEKVADGFSFDKNLGMVKFNELIVLPKSSGYSDGGFVKGIVHLVAAYEKKDLNNYFDLYTRDIDIPGGTEGFIFIEDGTLVEMWKKAANSTYFLPVNHVELNTHADKVLNQIKNYYLSRYPKIYTYPGIFPVGAWGGIRNVVWSADAQSGGFTEIHKDMEVPKPLLPDYTEREMRRKFKILWRTRKDSKEVKKVWPFE